MVALLMYLKQRKFIYFLTYLLLANVAVAEFQVKFLRKPEEFHPPVPQDETRTQAMIRSETIKVAALGRPLFLGTLYNCHEDSFIPGVTLWDKKSINEDLARYPKPDTYSTLSSSDSLSSKFSLLDASASLKASFLAGLVKVEGSASYLHHTKSSNQQSRVTMFYRETTSYEHLTMTQLDSITYPQVFDQKTATHVVTAVLYGVQAFMVFDYTLSEDEKEQHLDGKLDVMVNNFYELSIHGQGSVNMTDAEKEMAKKITYKFHGDFILDQNPTTFKQAMEIYNQLPALVKNNPQRVVPIKVWLYPLNLLDHKAAQLEREISTSLLYNIEHIMDLLGDAERTYNDLSGNTLVKRFRDIKERLGSFQDSFNLYKAMLLKAVGRVLPGIRAGKEEENCMKKILKIHSSSPFHSQRLMQWLHDAQSELDILSSYKKALHRIKIENSDHLNTIFLDFDIDAVVSLTFTSLEYEDPYLSALQEFLKVDRFNELDQINTFSVKSVRKWFKDHHVIIKMRENLSKFTSFAEANKDEKKIRFIISAISNPNIAGSSIYLYEKGELTDTQFQPVSKPPPPIVKNVLDQSVSLILQTPSSTERVLYRVEYKKVKQNSGDEEPWLFKNTDVKQFTLTGLESGKQYLIRCRIVGKVGVSEASDTVSSFVGTEIVGGTGGDEFSFKSTLDNAFQKIIITYNLELEEEGFFWSTYHVTTLNTVQVMFQDYQMIQVGRVKGSETKEFNFDKTDTIVSAKLWPNRMHNRLGGLEFMVEKKNGEKIKMSLTSKWLGKPVTLNVKSGRCYGIKGRSGDEIDALGFYFI